MVVAYLPLISFIVLIGLYPLQFFMVEGAGILSMKSNDLLNDPVWKAFFNTHIVFGGLALLIGWTQFNRYLRTHFKKLHRVVGFIYVSATWLSVLGIAYISFFAEGGPIAFVGFSLSGIIWFYTTLQGYITIRKGEVVKHQQFMIYSYATCLGAATLRIWLPLLVITTDNFILSYQWVAWLSWVPNVMVAYLIVQKQKKKVKNNAILSAQR